MKWLYVGLTLSLCSCHQRENFNAPGLFISFDDRSIEEWLEIDSLFEKDDFRATFYVTQFDSLSRTEIATLKKLEEKGHEIGYHGLRHLHAEYYIKNFGYSQYISYEIDSGLLLMEKENLFPSSFAYPYGEDYWFTDFLLLQKFQSVRRVAALKDRGNLTDIPEVFYAICIEVL